MRKRPIGLDDDDMLDVVIEQAAANKNGFTTSRVEWIFDLTLDRVFAGSMACDRIKVEQLAGSPSGDRSTLLLFGAWSACRTLVGQAQWRQPIRRQGGYTGV